MTTPLVLTFVGDDRPGLVNAISEKVAACGATWLESRSVRLAGKFAGVVLSAFPTSASRSSNCRCASSRPPGCASRSSAARRRRRKSRRGSSRLDIVGSERPGIVRDVTQALTRLGVNIEEFASGLEGEPFTGAEMFRAKARLSVPEGLELDDLRKALERLAGEIMVDLAVGEEPRS